MILYLAKGSRQLSTKKGGNGAMGTWEEKRKCVSEVWEGRAERPTGDLDRERFSLLCA